MCLALACCALFAACEPASVAVDEKTPITLGSGRTHATAMTNANALLWGYTQGTNGYWVFAGGETDANGLTEGENAQYVEDATNGDYLLPAVTRYWADNQTYNFYSVWPIVPLSTVQTVKFNQTNSQLSFSYGSIEQQVDLCVAAAIGEQGGSNRNTAVNLVYKHMLSKVAFRGYSSIALDAKLTKLEIVVPEGATAQFTLTSDTEEGEGKELTAYSYDFTKTDGVINTTTLTKDGTFTLLANPDKSESIAGTDVAEWLVFPKTIAKDEIKIRATYLLGDGTDASNTKTVESTLPATTWQPGKRYIYDFYVQPSGPITFGTFSVRDWIDDENNREEIDLS